MKLYHATNQLMNVQNSPKLLWIINLKYIINNGKKDIYQELFCILVIIIKLSALCMIGRCNSLSQIKMRKRSSIKIYLHLCFISMIVIKDTAMRTLLLHSNDKSDVSLISKEANKNKSENDFKGDVHIEEKGEGENIYIYITGQRVVNNTFRKLMCEGEVDDSDVKSCEKDSIINSITKK